MSNIKNPTRSDWIKVKANNINLIIQNKMQIEMAEKIILLCDEKISKFKDIEKTE